MNDYELSEMGLDVYSGLTPNGGSRKAYVSTNLEEWIKARDEYKPYAPGVGVQETKLQKYCASCEVVQRWTEDDQYMCDECMLN